MVWDDMMIQYGATNLNDNFPRCFNHLVVSDLAAVVMSLRA